MKKIFILDAVNYLFRSYYAIGPMTNDKGQSTSALFGFIRSLNKLIKDFSPTHLVCVFDGPDNKKARRAVFAEYKMHRKGAPEDLFPQFQWAYDYCKIANIPVLCIEEVEADDTIASVAVWAQKEDCEVYICSSDKDLMQLVNDKTFMLHLHKDNLVITKEEVVNIFGVRPDQILDLLAIMGDASDNIPGLEGFGPKTAASLLQEFGTLDEILKHPEKVKGAKKQEILKTKKEDALLSKELATLNVHVEIPKNEKFYEIGSMDLEAVKEFFKEMKFTSLLKALDETQIKQEPIKKHETIQYHLIEEEKDLINLLEKLNNFEDVCIDTETTDINPLLAHLVGIGFSVNENEAYYVPLNAKLSKHTILHHLKNFFESTSCAFFGHNFKYDYHILQNVKCPINKISFDTILASYVLDPQNRKHNLDELSFIHLEKKKIELESLIGKGKSQISVRDVPIDKMKQYCCEDVDYTFRLKKIFEKQLKEKNLESIFYNIELPLLPILAKMEKEGIYLDVEELKKVGKQVNHDLSIVKKEIFNEIGEEFNLNSPKQLSQILYEKLQIKSKTTSTNADVLEELQDEYPIVKKILEYRGLEKLRSTYIDALPLYVNPITSRVHCTFNQSITATGRLSSQDPNLQNIPLDSSIRACFKPEKKGYSFLASDYSQIELRLLAHFCQDEKLINAFKKGHDIHRHTASLVFAVDEELVTEEMRRSAKTVNFGILYGQSAFGLAKQLSISQKEASSFIKKYFEQYPKVLDYLEQSKEKARKLGFSTTLTGRQRPIPEINNKNPLIRAAAERLAINTPLQGTAADLIKMAMIQIDKEIQSHNLKGKMILQIHDELIFEIPDEEIEIFKKLVKKHMEHVMELSVPTPVQIAVGKNWAAC